MELTVIAQNIEQIKSDNLKWLRFAELLVNAVTPKTELFPQYGEQCKACQWLYEHSDEIMDLCMSIDRDELDCFHFDLIDEIEILRYELHEKYFKIFKTALLSSENSFVATLLNLLNTPVSFEMEVAKSEYTVMKRLVNEIDVRLDNLYYSLSRYSDQKIA